MRWLLRAAVAVLLLVQPAALSSPARAAATIVNPDFETGDLSGWSVTGTAFTNAVTTDTRSGRR